jgi:hypothetical protein
LPDSTTCDGPCFRTCSASCLHSRSEMLCGHDEVAWGGAVPCLAAAEGWLVVLVAVVLVVAGLAGCVIVGRTGAVVDPAAAAVRPSLPSPPPQPAATPAIRAIREVAASARMRAR